MLCNLMRPCVGPSCLQVDVLIVSLEYGTLPLWVATALSVIVTCACLHDCNRLPASGAPLLGFEVD